MQGGLPVSVAMCWSRLGLLEFGFPVADLLCIASWLRTLIPFEREYLGKSEMRDEDKMPKGAARASGRAAASRRPRKGLAFA